MLPTGLSVWAARGKNGYSGKGLSVMGEDMAGQEAAKPRKRSAAKPPVRLSVSKVKATIHLSVEASQRLDIHATMMGFDRSALVEKLINDHLRRYVVSDRGGAEGNASGEAVA
jgi:hypothetical protein